MTAATRPTGEERLRRGAEFDCLVARWRTALHEAGHAVAAHLLGLSVSYVTIEPGRGHRGWNGYCRVGIFPRSGTRSRTLSSASELVPFALSCAAGPAVELRLKGTARLDHADLELAARVAAVFGREPMTLEWRGLMLERANAIVASQWPVIHAVAVYLVEHGTLRGRRKCPALIDALLAARRGAPGPTA